MGPRRFVLLIGGLALLVAPPLPARAGEAEESASPVSVGLAQAVRLALENNDEMLNAGDGVTLARARRQAARAEFLPQLTPGLQRSEQSTALLVSGSQRLPFTGGSLQAAATLRRFEEAEDPFSRTSDLRLTLAQPLLRGFGPTTSHANLYFTRRDLQGRERALELTRQRLAVRVAAAFYDVVQQRQLLAVARQSLERSQELQRSSEAKLQAGLVSRLDVYRAELQAAQSEEAVVRSEAALETAHERFRVLLGLPTTDPIEPGEADLPEDDLGPAPEDVEVLVERARARRLDLQESESQIEDAARNLSIARQNLWPQLDLNLAFTQTGFADSFGGSLRSGDSRFEVFMSTSYPLDRSSARATRTAAEVQAAGVRRSLAQQQRQVDAEVRSAVRELHRLRRSIELQRRSVLVTEQQLRLAALRYQRGLASNFDVVDAEGSVVLARSTLVNLLTSYRVARLELRRVTGELDVLKDFE